MLRARPLVRRWDPFRIMGKKLVEIYQLSLRVVDNRYALHLSKRMRVGIVEYDNIAIRCLFPQTSYRSPGQFWSIEMNYADILLHKIKGGARFLPPHTTDLCYGVPKTKKRRQP